MKQVSIYLMIYLGSALLAYNIYRYFRFSRDVRRHGNWDRERWLLNMPLALIILFLFGYLAVGLFGRPDLIVSGILFGGSLFVSLMVFLIQRALDRIRENESLEAKLTAAEAASRAKTFFLSNMSHDIRTPLNAIIGYTALADQDGVTPEQQRSYIRKIDRAGRQLLEIVNDVLEMSRIESGKVHLEPHRVNLEECVLESADLIRTQMETKGIAFTVDSDVRRKWVLCDRSLLERALMNLLSNAQKFTGEGGRVALRLAELGGNEDTGDYEIRVRDTGIGMSDEFVEHLFSPFERERTSTISKTQGTGLGMTISKNIVEMMGGTIRVNTEKGQGTEFVINVSFPVESPGESHVAAKPDAARFDGIRALLVEDNPVNAEIAGMLLTQAGFEVETAENGQVAVDKVSGSAAGYYGVVLMDVQMPVMDGYTAARAIRALPDAELASVPIIAMTANVFEEDVRRTREAGMNAHIAKPLDIQLMMATLKSVLLDPGDS